jgi:succinyl-diaminopimelate desuccinylase
MTRRLRDAVAIEIDNQHAAQVRFLAELIKVPADNPPGDCAPHANRAAELLGELGFSVSVHPVPSTLVCQRGMMSATNLIVRERFGDGPTIALAANGDAVKPGEGWTTDPYGGEVRDGAIYGRGAAWAKSDFATFAYALAALKATGALDRGTIELHFTYDEEVGGEIGPKWLLEQQLSAPDMVIVSGFSYWVLTSHNGCLHLNVQLLGKSAHAMAPELGHDALEAATSVLSALYTLRRSYESVRSRVPGIASPTLNVGLIDGGINTNVVPDLVSFSIDRRIIPEEDPDTVERDLRHAIQDAAARHVGIECTVRRTMLALPLTSTAEQTRLVNAIRNNAREVFGIDIPAQGMPIYTDARHYGAARIPTVLYGAGPKSFDEAGVHKADEHVRLDDLRNATKVVAFTLMDLLADKAN